MRAGIAGRVLFGLLAMASVASAQSRGGVVRFHENVRGDLTMASNAILSCADGSSADFVSCEDARRRNPVMRNNVFDMTWIDADGDDTTFDSSAATLSLPDDATIAWARLYWMCATGRGIDPPSPSSRGTVKLKAPGGSYVPLRADVLDTGLDDQAHGDLYLASADVTGRVSDGGAGTWWVADMQCAHGTTNLFGGWSLLVAYEQDGAGLRDVAVFDAYRRYSTDPTSYAVDGFLTPPNGPVRTRVAVVLGDGDAGRTDHFTLVSNRQAVELGDAATNALNPLGDIANSTITLLGASAPGRIPSYDGTFGFDADLIETVGALPNGATRATVEGVTDQENVYTGVVAFSTDMLAPDLRFTKAATDLDGELVRRGDVIEYVLTAQNVGGAGAIGTVVRDALPDHLLWQDGSITIDGRGLTDASDADDGEWDPATRTVTVRPPNGAVASGQTFVVKFRVTIDPATEEGTVISNQAGIAYEHAVLGPDATYTGKSDGDPRKVGAQPTDLWPVEQKPFPIVTLQKDVLPTTAGDRVVKPGGTVTWTLTIANAEPARDATTAVLDDVLPDGLTFVSASSEPEGVSVLSTSPIRLKLPVIPGGGAVVVHLTTTVAKPWPAGPLANQAEVSGDDFELVPSDDPLTDLADDPTVITVLPPSGFSGGACGCDPSSTPAALLLLVLFLRRRRGLVVALVLVASAANAQDSAGFTLDRYRPALLPTDALSVAGARTPGHLKLSTSLTLDYAHDPLVYEDVLGDASTEQASVVSHQLVAHASFALGLGENTLVFAQLPVNALLVGQAYDVAPAPEGSGLGDAVLGGRWRFLGDSQGPGAALQLAVAIPTALWSSRSLVYAGDRGPGLTALVTGDGSDGPFSFVANAGVRLRPGATLENLDLGHEALAGFALSMQLREERDLTAVAEISAATALAHPFTRELTPVESLFGLRWLATPDLLLTFGAGPGLVRGAGSPDVRGLVQLAYTPVTRPPQDSDGDGLLDPVDTCPAEPEDLDGFEDTDGCPDLDDDHDGVPDRVDACPRVPEDADGFEDQDGCPDPDDDQDGVPDTTDVCSRIPEDCDGFEDTDGCPDPDDDQDGVLDDIDACPRVPGPPAYAGCPAIDTDLDTLPDDVDACPDTPGPVDNGGCPRTDGDHDGVFDPADRCPDAPGPATNNGCPLPVLVVRHVDHLEILDTIHFDTDRDTIQPRSFPLLQAVADVLKEHPSIKRVRVEGHTDARGSDAYNRDLANRRARSVVRFLVEEAGIAENRLESEGYGRERPVAPNLTKHGRRKNRRVEFRIVDGGDVTETVTTPGGRP